MKVLMLAGGDSPEREVSLSSGSAVFKALCGLGYEVLALDPATGQCLLGDGGAYIGNEVTVHLPVSQEATTTALTRSLSSGDYKDVDVVFIALHGGSGEDGTIQNLLHLAGMKYTGSNMAASAVAMDKGTAKRLMESVGVATPGWKKVKLDSPEQAEAISADILSELAPPLIVKPNDGGSTIGLTKVEDPKTLPEAVCKAAEHSREILVEQYIQGRELTVTVLDGKAYPVVEIRPVGGLYDYEAKYTKGKSEYIAPAPIDEALSAGMQEVAVKVYEVIRASGLTRVDFILDEAGRYYCLELNTLPGMTELSLAPMAMKAVGISFERLVEMVIESAMKRKD